MWELQELKRVRKDLQPDQDIESKPLSLRIQEVVLPNFRVLKEKFDGMTDLTDHVIGFESTLDQYKASNAVKYRAFPATFKGVARLWYDSLPPQSITKFKQFKRLFVGHFMANKR